MPVPCPEHQPNILLVGSDQRQQQSLVAALWRLNMPIFEVFSPQDASAVALQVLPALVLLNLSTLNDEGFELCQDLKNVLPTQATPVLFLSEDAAVGDRLRAFEVGAADFIDKPYWVEEVLARVKVHLPKGTTRLRVPPPIQRFYPYAQPSSLLANLQKTLHQQAVKLHQQNTLLQREVRERQQVEQALRQAQQKSEQLLLNILPEAIVTQLKQFQGSLAQRYDEATVLFADIVNFTPLAARQSPLELVNLLNQIFSAFDRLAEKYQLEKIKTIGDAYMVVGGVPVPHPNHTMAMADMALEMQQVIQQFNSGDGAPMRLRIGINTGSVVAGVIGIKKFSYDLWGDTVNVASRMESQGVPDKIQVTETTYQQLQSAFLFAPAQEIEVKGKGPMRTYYLLGRCEGL